jgi:excisionase family DNA binding protein
MHPDTGAAPEAPLAFKLAYNKGEAAEMLSVSVRTVDNLLALKELVSRRVGRRVVIPHQAIVQFLRSDHRTVRVGRA